MHIALLVVALTACGFPKPADLCDGPCGMFEIDRSIVNAGDELWLEGTFEDGTLINFPGIYNSQPFNARYEHRASVIVPEAATSGDLSITTRSGAVDGKLPFRRTTFKLTLQPFTAVNEQNDYARSNYLDRVHVGGAAVTIGSRVYLLGGEVGGAPTADVEVAAAGLDGSLGKPNLIGGMQTYRAYHTTIRVGHYIYVIGGLGSGPDTPLRTVERAAIDDQGKLGPFENVSEVNLVVARYGHQSTIIGNYVYVIGGKGDQGELGDVERAPIYLNDQLGTFEPISDVSMDMPRSHFAIVKGANYLYVIGGLRAGLPTERVEKLEMFGNGYISDFQGAGQLFQPRANHAALVLGNRVYVFGGSGMTGALQVVESSLFSSEGTLDFIGMPDVYLPAPKADAAVTMIGNYVYVIGGQPLGSGPTSLVERASIINSSQIDTFASDQSALNTPRSMHANVVIGQWLYVIGGQNGSGPLSTIEIAEIRPDGSLSEFALYPYTLKKGRFGHTALIVDDVLYIIGGIDSAGNVLDTIETAKINEDGSLEAPQTHLVRLFAPRGRFTMFAQGIYAYVFGGRTATGTPNTDLASIEYGIFDSGTQLTGFNDYNIDTIKETREGAASIVVGDFVYMIGGDNNGSYRGVARVRVPFSDYTFVGLFAIYANSLMTPRSGHTVTRVGEALYAIGGADTGPTVEAAGVARDGTVGQFGSSSTITLMTNRRGHSTVTIGNNVYIIGGQAIAGPYLLSLERATIR